MRTAAFAITALLASSGCVDMVANMDGDFKVTERDEKHFTTSSKPEVSLSTFDGPIEVRPWDKTEVSVVIEKRGPSKESLADLVIDARQDGNRVTVEVKHPKHGGWNFGMSANAKLIVSLPATADVSARSGDGSIDVERIAGRVELRSGDGSIRARDLSGEVTVSTGDGSIVLDGRFATLKAHTGDGSVRISAARGSDPAGDWEVTTGDGSITLEIPGGFNSEIDAHTGDGRVRVEDVEVSNVAGELRKNSLKGRIGSGGRLVRLRTGDGSITLRRS